MPRLIQNKGRFAARLRTAVLITVILTWLIVPLVGIWVITRVSEDVTLAPPSNVPVPVAAATEALTQAASLVIDRDAAPQVLSPPLSGTVNAVYVTPGDTLASGQLMISVDRFDRIAFNSQEPFTRPLIAGDKGNDVAALNSMLSTLGYSASGGVTFTASTARGVASLSRSLGGSAASTEVFDPTWVIFLPVPQLRITRVGIDVGAPAPAAGSILAEGAASITSARLVAYTEQTAEPTPAPAEGEASDSAEDTVAPMSGLPSITAPSDATLVVGVTPLELNEDRTTVSPEALIELQELAPNGETLVAAQLSQPPVAGSFSVPASAIFVTSDGTNCLVRHRGRSNAAVPVSVVGGDYDRTVVLAPLQSGDDVLVSPSSNLRQACVEA